MKFKLAFVVFLTMLAVGFAGCFGGGDSGSGGTSGGGKTSGGGDDSGAKKTTPFPADKATGSVKGSVKWEGEVTPPASLGIETSDKVCAQNSEKIVDEALLINDNKTLRNVFVYVKEGGQWDCSGYTGKNDAKQDVVVTQEGCTYHPHVIGYMVGQNVKVKSLDNTTHNVHFKSKKNGEFNFTQAMNQEDDFNTGGMKGKNFKKEEVGGAKFVCDVHSWMSSHVCIVTHPFYHVTGADGSFEIGKLPAGKYTLVAWHEKLGTKEVSVEVKDNEAATADFSFAKK